MPAKGSSNTSGVAFSAGGPLSSEPARASRSHQLKFASRIAPRDPAPAPCNVRGPDPRHFIARSDEPVHHSAVERALADSEDAWVGRFKSVINNDSSPLSDREAGLLSQV